MADLREGPPGIFRRRDQIFTRNLVPGTAVYGERLLQDPGGEYRQWIPQRSKYAALLRLGIEETFVERDSSLLYLGASTGTTVSHLSDIVTAGRIIAVEKSIVSARSLVQLAARRKNLFPLVADAGLLHTQQHLIGTVDALYQDVSQSNQAGIFIDACDQFLKTGGLGLLLVKARSVDVARPVKEVFHKVSDQLGEMFTILHRKTLEPFEKDHMAIWVRA